MKLRRINKEVVSFKGPVEEFLNGLTSNTLDAPQNAFLNVHGRIIAVFEQIRLNAEEFWIVVHSDLVEPLKEHLDKYLQLSGVSMTVLDWFVYYDLTSEKQALGDEILLPKPCGQMLLSSQKYPSTILSDEFKLFRVLNNLPLHGVDYTDQMVLNVSPESLVSFTKGCFLGQEPVSKVHNRSKPTWKLVVKNVPDCSDEELEKMTSRVLDPEDGLEKGFVFVKNSDERL